ncbi:MAG: ankyrin repeat domain-containing protein, partial [Candidatus Rifleibacteriota bacterium]
KKALKSGADINESDKYGFTALISASANNKNPEIIKTRIKAGANINAS